MAAKKKSKKTPHRSAGRRRTVEQEQERASKKQLADAWDPPWVVSGIDPDLGEDLLVRIYDKGVSSGLSFYVQLKSTPNVGALLLMRRPDIVSYPLETKDLHHWEGSSTPVVLVVWDVTSKSGVWLDVPTIVKQLDGSRSRWRRKKTVKVLLPIVHGTDENGRVVLRKTIAMLAMPILSRGKTIEVTPTFSFPPTTDGRKRFRALKRVMDEGGTVTIDKEFIEEFRTSDWYDRAVGGGIPESLTISSRAEPMSLPLRLQVTGPERAASLAIELRRTRAGMKKAIFTTSRKGAPVTAKVVLSDYTTGNAKISTRFGFHHPCCNVHECLDLTRLLIACKQGGKLQVILSDGTAIGELDFPDNRPRPLDELLTWEEILQKLAFVQSHAARYGLFDASRLGNEDVPLIQQLFDVMSTGKYATNLSMSFTMRRPIRLPESARPGAFQIDPFEPVEVLGVRVPMGKVQVEVLDVDGFFSALIAARDSDDEAPSVSLNSIPVMLHAVDWGPGKDGPDGPRTGSALIKPE